MGLLNEFANRGQWFMPTASIRDEGHDEFCQTLRKPASVPARGFNLQKLIHGARVSHPSKKESTFNPPGPNGRVLILPALSCRQQGKHFSSRFALPSEALVS